MSKEELIEQQRTTSRRKAQMIDKAILQKSGTVSAIPNLDFWGLQKRIILITEDIRKLTKSSFLTKMKHSLLGANEGFSKGSHINGSILSQALNTGAMRRIVTDLNRDPSSTNLRVQLLRTFMKEHKDHELEVYRNLIVQGALPIYLGDVTPAATQVAAQTYRLYLQKLINAHKKQLLLVRSSQLKDRVNIDRIPIDSLLRSDKATSTPEEAMAVLEIKVCLNLQDQSQNVDTEIKQNMTMPVNLNELDHLSARHNAVMQFLGGDETGQTYNKRKLLIRKSMAVVDVTRYIPFLHSLGLKIAGRLQELEGKTAQPFLLEARIHMAAVRFLMLRMQSEDNTARVAIAPTFNKAIVAYRKALKRTSFSDPHRSDLPVMGEYAQVSNFAFQNRELMKLSNDGVLDNLRMAKKAVDAAVIVNRHYGRLQLKILNAINILETKKLGAS
jgi:hypothetical protein